MIHADPATDAYHAPEELRVTDARPTAMLLVGSCALDSYPEVIRRNGVACDFFNVNHAMTLPDLPPKAPADYGFQIVQIPLRSLIPDARLMRLSYGDLDGHHRLFEDAKSGLGHILANLLRWTVERGIPAFVMNFLTPQQNPYGRLFPRYDIRNVAHFVELLNQHLGDLLQAYPGAHLLDVDQLAAMEGRRFIQDDSLCLFSHGALLSDYDAAFDAARLDGAPQPVLAQIGADPLAFVDMVWRECLAMYRSLAGRDAVKLVVVDFDDTLWRGVPAEGDDIDPSMTEGWPIGFAEALLYLKRRGILLAALSRNDDARVRALWDRLYGDRLRPDDFVCWQVSWDDKPERMEEILRQTGVLPGNVLFIDDNPRERAAMAAAFPGMRLLGPNPYAWRRLLLWSAETQVRALSEESARRTEMVKAQITRDTARRNQTREEFLAELGCSLRVHELCVPEDCKFTRVLELLNRSNQFNTTGRRWSAGALADFLGGGGRIFAFEAVDRFTHYGVIAVALLDGATIGQFVMSCRVFGLDIEIAAVAQVLRRIGPGLPARGLLTCTEANLPVRDLWQKLGFAQEGEDFILPPASIVTCPAHIVVEG